MIKRLGKQISNRQKAWGSLALMVLALSFLLYLPADHFDEGQSICLSVVLFDMECYGCGMTRGIQHLIHFEFAEAWRYNKMAFLVFPLLLYLIFSQIYKWHQLKD